jgi:hypothetical protein
MGVVIPFPAGPSRLDRALAALQRATQEQQAAVAAWRASLAELRQSVSGLANSMATYRSALATTAGRVDDLGAQARRLESTCDTLNRTVGDHSAADQTAALGGRA